jgi:hypothetical protein
MSPTTQPERWLKVVATKAGGHYHVVFLTKNGPGDLSYAKLGRITADEADWALISRLLRCDMSVRYRVEIVEGDGSGFTTHDEAAPLKEDPTRDEWKALLGEAFDAAFCKGERDTWNDALERVVDSLVEAGSIRVSG